MFVWEPLLLLPEQYPALPEPLSFLPGQLSLLLEELFLLPEQFAIVQEPPHLLFRRRHRKATITEDELVIRNALEEDTVLLEDVDHLREHQLLHLTTVL